MAPSTWGLRLLSSPSESRTLELIPSAPMTRSAGHSRPPSVMSTPSARTPVACELAMISTPARCAAPRIAARSCWRVMQNMRDRSVLVMGANGTSSMKRPLASRLM